MFKFNGVMINDAAEWQRQVDEFKRNSERPVMGAETDFGERLKETTKRRLAGYHPACGTASGTTGGEESFAEKLTKAVEVVKERRGQSHKQHAERAE